MNAIVVPTREPAAARLPQSRSELRPADKPKRILSQSPQLFRIQFVGTTPDRAQTVLKEIWIRAADTSAAIVAVAKTVFPPQTIGLRILDREGREVFERQRADRR